MLAFNIKNFPRIIGEEKENIGILFKIANAPGSIAKILINKNFVFDSDVLLFDDWNVLKKDRNIDTLLSCEEDLHTICNRLFGHK